MESFFDRQLSVSVDQLGTLSKVWNFLSNVYEILPKSTRPSSFRHFPSPILGHSDNLLQLLSWFDIHRQILSLLAQLMSASVKSCRIFSYQGTIRDCSTKSYSHFPPRLSNTVASWGLPPTFVAKCRTNGTIFTFYLLWSCCCSFVIVYNMRYLKKDTTF